MAIYNITVLLYLHRPSNSMQKFMIHSSKKYIGREYAEKTTYRMPLLLPFTQPIYSLLPGVRSLERAATCLCIEM